MNFLYVELLNDLSRKLNDISLFKLASEKMFLLALASVLVSSAARTPQIIPQPESLEVISGEDWSLTNGMTIGYDSSIPEVKDLVQFVSDSLRVPTGFRFNIVADQEVVNGLYFGKMESNIDGEYHLTMTTQLVTIYGRDRLSLFYGLQTLLQLLPPQIYSSKAVTTVSEWKAQLVIVHDSPRFVWRGVMVDPCRHFFSVDVVKSIIDGMSHYKLNTLHLHLTDDQGWRIELKKFPKLIENGATRDSSPKMWDRWVSDDTQYGPYYYTEDDIQDLLQYAKERCVTIVPEIEMPGHGLACLSGYPEYSCRGGPFKPYCWWGVSDDIFCAGNDDTLGFLESILDEVLKVFNSTYIHCGGDEAPKQRWNTCSKCQARIKALGLSSANDLQQWFTQHFARYLDSRGRRLVGWDEILEGSLELPKQAVVMSWRANGGGQVAARKGHNVVMSPCDHIYLDYNQFKAVEKYEYIGSYSTVKMCYFFDPQDGLEDEYKHYILGSQGNLFSEYIWEREDLHYKAFPRIVALSESTWTKSENKNWERFIRSLEQSHYEKIRQMGVDNAAPLSLGTEQAIWTQGEFSGRWVSVTFPITGAFNQKGTYEIAFIHVKGEDGLKIRNVKLLIDNVEIDSDIHEGRAGNPGENNIYTVTVADAPGASQQLAVHAEVCADGEYDTTGVIHVYPADVKN
ncbi:Beta-hexosaminidase [Tritrichomonas foetus]|uniref:beta-N-acetylhexosaminidase n=1 Tax=Tritrichomonas foetus TaxID=1144522 RepID=A0A1J4KH68_9EUKA|nr:Beta-hexosaminidase [Tritrichomonas foetus]|eukprot:OHT10304.1 Beta-hexosaminidase [Tritrichomonas foetus]